MKMHHCVHFIKLMLESILSIETWRVRCRNLFRLVLIDKNKLLWFRLTPHSHISVGHEAFRSLDDSPLDRWCLLIVQWGFLFGHFLNWRCSRQPSGINWAIQFICDFHFLLWQYEAVSLGSWWTGIFKDAVSISDSILEEGTSMSDRLCCVCFNMAAFTHWLFE